MDCARCLRCTPILLFVLGCDSYKGVWCYEFSAWRQCTISNKLSADSEQEYNLFINIFIVLHTYLRLSTC